MAILGSDNSGKEYLTKLLAGYFREDEGKCEGAVRVGGVEGLTMQQIRKLCGYVVKRDWLSKNLTPRETIRDSAKFRLGYGKSC